jgi:hypothetical protein
MCPDPQLISVYYDGELPSPWKEKMESHLAFCQKCQQRLDSYGLFSPHKQELGNRGLLDAQQRVWKKFEEKTGIGSTQPESPYPYVYSRKPQYVNFWGRRLSVPLPAAAAAAALFIIAITLLWAVQAREQKTMPHLTVASEEFSLWPSAIDGFDTQGMVPVTDLSGVIQYLGSRDSGDIVILRLPETRSFISSGEPAMIRAADYSRRRP